MSLQLSTNPSQNKQSTATIAAKPAADSSHSQTSPNQPPTQRIPKSIQYDESTKTSIFNFGDNNTFNVDQSTTNIYRSKPTLNAVSKVASPLRRQGIKTLKVKNKDGEIAALSERDFPQVDNLSSPLSLNSSSNQEANRQPQELIIRIVKPNFSDEKWTVSDGGKPFNVSMDDERFRELVHAREIGFYDGDLYRVQMLTSQKVDGRGVSTVKSIVKVIEQVQLEIQDTLQLDEPKPKGKRSNKARK